MFKHSRLHKSGLHGDGNEDELVENFVLYIEKLSSVAETFCMKKFSDLLHGLELFNSFLFPVEEKFKLFRWSDFKTYESLSIDCLISGFKCYLSELSVIGC